jgi:hypothetical protein
MEIYTNEYGKVCYKNVKPDDDFCLFNFTKVENTDDRQQWALHTNLGSLTVLDRQTGYIGGFMDTETGFRETKEDGGRFWLASGMVDVRNSGEKTIGQAIEYVKRNANTCIGV